MADLSTWSTTAASNNSTPPDGWPEGQNPSTVNDCAREMMAQVATWRQKFGGWMMENVGIAAAVATNDLTVSLKVKDGSTNPSSTNKVGIGFRSATLTSGAFEYVQATAATSVILPGGGSLGFTNSQTGNIFVYAINNAGAIEVGIAGVQFDESILYSSIAIGTGSDSSIVLYSTSARSNVAIRLIGRITIQYGTGAWTNSPSVIAPASPEMGTSGSFTGTLTGLTTSPTVEIYYSASGGIASIHFSDVATGTSNSPALTITGMPAVIRPKRVMGDFLVIAVDNGTPLTCEMSIAVNGTISYSTGIVGGSFTASGTKGIHPIAVTYPLA